MQEYLIFIKITPASLFLASRVSGDKKMRLKFLFFPVMIVVSLAVFFGFVWPEIDNVKTANEEKKVNTRALDDIKKRKSDINLLGNQIASSTDDKKIVNSYLPEKNAEERIVGGINYLASDAGVSLLNVSIAKSSENALAGSTSIANEQSSSKQGSSNNAANNEAGGMQFNETTISVIGEYDKIQLFIDKLQKIALFNSIKSLTIKNGTEKNLTNAMNNANEQVSLSKNLTAEIVIKFGYLKKYDFSNQISSIGSEIDQETINALKLYISQKDASIISEIGSAGSVGKTNPFFLE